MATSLQEHIDKLEAILGKDILSEEGTVFFSGNQTLTAGNGVYLLGANPGGKPDPKKNNTEPKQDNTDTKQNNTKPKQYNIGESLEKFKSNPDRSLYLDEYWKSEERMEKNTFQKNLELLFVLLKLELIETCSSNLVFKRSTDFTKISKREIPAYLKAHEYIINSALHPSVIITLGKHAYNALKNCWQDDLRAEELFGNSELHPADIQSTDGTKLLLYIPHPSNERWFGCFKNDPEIARKMKEEWIGPVLDKRRKDPEVKWNLKL